MRIHGTVVSWNGDRGFGFVRPAGKDTGLFIHISAFPRGGPLPQVGELISFEIDATAEKPRGINVQRTGAARAPSPRPPRRATPRRRPFPVTSWLTAAALVAIAAALLVQRWPTRPAWQPAAATSAGLPAARQVPDATYRCDGRTRCAQMTSCAEATWFIGNCPNTQMDGNGDGVPCESQWCR
ncbi:excalibur calcium-binding domain-containing protein [Stenotrophomonas sp. YIM B06876]|uniref:excalibur calcium-binding domain-containing protein n=1 Tax=Stenotrophomonas sp. YIM B06876 TaxID=3060211 RepID=UPI002738D2E5|nr:excalibur calcium-binding domain-containing protein [Stenotrophomonas sp. YIM B06876]